MKITILSILISFLSIHVKIISQTLNNDIIYKAYLVFSSDVKKQDLKNILNYEWKIISFNEETIYNGNTLISLNNESQSTVPDKKAYNSAIVECSSGRCNLETLNNIIYSNKFVLSGSGKEYCNTNVFYCKLSDLENYNRLLEVALKNNFNIIGHDPLMPHWVVGYITNQSNIQNINDVVKYLRSNSFIEKASVSKIVENFSLCKTDPLFNDQWGLNNTGINQGVLGTDIKLCEFNALGIQLNSTIRVGVLDRGIDNIHPDINNFTFGFDTETNSIGADIYGIHGTACAGIIGASSDNGLGISGIIDQCNLVPISNTLRGVTAGDEQRLALGLNWAWQNGVDVISNSWGHDLLQNPIIDNAISNALTQGRGGLGCVVVYSSGNEDGNVIYPANSNPNILAVGAVDRCGIRSGRIDRIPNSCDPWPSIIGLTASQFGNELDVVGPGSTIFTTVNAGTGNVLDDYTNDFGGTSAATPHVSALAATLYSIYPCLTNIQVNNIIESSAQKVGPYAYQNEPGRPNGSWNQEVGYGLIDMKESALKIYDLWLLQNDFISGESKVSSLESIRAGYDVTNRKSNGNYVISYTSTSELTAQESITLEDGLIIEEGAEFLAQIKSFDNDCANWTTSIIAPDSKKEITYKNYIQPYYKDNNTSEKYNIYPNPFQDFIQINDGNEIKEISIFSTTGKLIKSFNSNFNHISLRNLLSGIYFVKISTENSIVTKRIIKQ